MKRDLSTQILLGYVTFSILLALASPHVSIAFPWISELPTVSTLVGHGAAKSAVVAYFSVMWGLLPIFLLAMMIWSPKPTAVALRSRLDRLLFITFAAILTLPLFVWILCFFDPIASGPRVKAMLYLSTHSKMALGIIYGFAFDGLLILLFGVFFAFPRLWFLRMKEAA